MNELQLIDKIRQIAGTKNLVRGIGDDCAIYRPKPGQDLLFTTDFLIEDVHFRRDIYPGDAVGHKALARSLSDIAAMGGDPQFCLLSLGLPDNVDDRWIGDFYSGFLELAKRFKTTLAGGDVSRASKVTCDVMVCGAVPRDRAIRRDGAHAGDEIYVSGPLGHDWRTYQRPEPRIAFGRRLRGRASAAIDISDGVSIDLHRLLKASGVSAVLESVPLMPGATLDAALHEGEDYELLFTMPKRLKPPAGAIRIGMVTPGSAGTVRFTEQVLEPMGYDHFRDDSEQPTQRASKQRARRPRPRR